MRGRYARSACFLTLLATWQHDIAVAKFQLEAGVHPVTRIIHMLQSMKKEIDCANHPQGYCNCEGSTGQHGKAINDASTVIQEYSAQLQAKLAEKEKVLVEVAVLKQNMDATQNDLSKAASIRREESLEFCAQEKEMKLNTAKLEKVIPAVEKAGAPLLRTLGLAAPRLLHFLKVNNYMSSNQRTAVLAFLDQGADGHSAEKADVQPSDVILAILKHLHAAMIEDLNRMESEEKILAKNFNDLQASKSHDIKIYETSILEQDHRLGIFASMISEASNALADAKMELAATKAKIKECTKNAQTMNNYWKGKAGAHSQQAFDQSDHGVDNQSHEPEIIRWAENHGIDHSKVKVTSFMHGSHMLRGLAAKKDIQKYERILYIPKHLIIHSSVMPLDKACHQLWETAASAHSQQILNLVYEKHIGKDSQWYDMIKNLPTLEEFRQYYPYALPDDFSKEFDFMPIVNGHRFWRESNNRLWRNASLFSPQCFPKVPSRDEFLWAECVISTRQFGFGRTGTGLVPLIDYANAALELGSEANSLYHNQAGSFILMATKNIKAGEEILDQYRADGTAADYFLDTWGVLPEPGHPSRHAVQKLSGQECSKAKAIWRKYVQQGKCQASAVVCQLVTLSGLHCTHVEYEL
eukprot:gnl/MRDRNA2_/MRDRNA2_110896_c0_seq1.p1 gnl/MRDRNA2_/MRDRNA2_110896_c0~~gnl/MRDRNA2_/MRDRNA2_110896_c0_seq1.p1  ORF type:complete len:638 (+),score=122.92 gnl/MRDRNA2_/MRDRNA2_110896_c0_seq1:92-2005(+)